MRSALLAGFWVNARLSAHALRDSPQEFNDLLENLKQSFEEYQTFAENLAQWKETDRVLAHKAARLAADAEFELAHLRAALGAQTPEQLQSSNNRRFYWWSARWAITQQKKIRSSVRRKNEIMEELRRLQQAFHLKSQEQDLLQQHRILLDISMQLNIVRQHQQVLAENAGIPLEDYSPPGTAFPSTEDILETLMRPRLRLDRSLLSVAIDVPLPRSRVSQETRRSAVPTMEEA